MNKILVTTRSFSSGAFDAVGELRAAGYDVVRAGTSHGIEELGPILAESIAWIVGTGPVTEGHLNAAPQLRVLARYGVGVDNIDLAAATARDLTVANTPEANSDSVADHAIALMLALLRHIIPADRGVRSGEWKPRVSRNLGELVVGVVGFGAIGRRVVNRLHGFGSDVLVADPFAEPESITASGAEPATLDDLALRCDLVTLHAPGDTTLIGGDWLSRARTGVILVNTGRARLIDETAVMNALRNGRIGGLAADAFDGDDCTRPAPLAAPDIADRVVLTPHIGTHTRDSIDRTSAVACREVLAVLAGRSPANPVILREES